MMNRGEVEGIRRGRKEKAVEHGRWQKSDIIQKLTVIIDSVIEQVVYGLLIRLLYKEVTMYI